MHLPHSKKCDKSQKFSLFGARKKFLREFFFRTPLPLRGCPPKKNATVVPRIFFLGAPWVLLQGAQLAWAANAPLCCGPGYQVLLPLVPKAGLGRAGPSREAAETAMTCSTTAAGPTATHPTSTGGPIHAAVCMPCMERHFMLCIASAHVVQGGGSCPRRGQQPNDGPPPPLPPPPVGVAPHDGDQPPTGSSPLPIPPVVEPARSPQVERAAPALQEVFWCISSTLHPLHMPPRGAPPRRQGHNRDPGCTSPPPPIFSKLTP